MASTLNTEKILNVASDSSPHIVILGAGCIGLSTASAILCLSDKVRISIVASHFSPDTTSDVAGGLWLPYKANHPFLYQWCEETLDWFVYLQKNGKIPFKSGKGQNDDSNPYGINLVQGFSFEATSEVEEDRASWKHILKSEIKNVPISSLQRIPEGATRLAILPNLPLVYSSRYLQTMRQELFSTGRVSFIKDKSITSIQDLVKKYKPDIVVNCAGLGARSLLSDPEIKPVRGCLVTLEVHEDIKKQLMGKIYVFDDNPKGLSYILPREDGVHVGGTYLVNEWNTTCSDEEAAAILNRAYVMVPELKKGKIIKQRAGLRPGRSNIRCERDLAFQTGNHSGTGKNPVLFHNYGHGGSGWTVHWGCAKHIAKQVVGSLEDSAPVHPTSKL